MFDYGFVHISNFLKKLFTLRVAVFHLVQDVSVLQHGERDRQLGSAHPHVDQPEPALRWTGLHGTMFAMTVIRCEKLLDDNSESYKGWGTICQNLSLKYNCY
jgi:hypothetical protein